MLSASTLPERLSVLLMATPNQRLQPTLAKPRAAEAHRLGSETQHMAGYAPNWRKQDRLFQKRERELLHALRTNASREKVAEAVENLRNAKLQIFKARFSQNSLLPAHAYVPGKKAEFWQSLTQEEILSKYIRRKPNQTMEPTR
jgi:hypothetical protein